MPKSKPEIKQDIKQIQAANRMRETIRAKVYPFLLELNDSIGFSKIFLQTASSSVDSIFNEKQRIMKIEEILPRLTEIFTSEDEKLQPEYEKYRRLFEILKDETIYDFNTMIQTLPRAIETYFTQQTDKRPVMEVNIEEILGK